MAEALTGAFLDIAVVENPGGTDETETLLSRTTEDVEIERDPNELDWTEHGNPRTQRREGQETGTITFQLIVTDDQQNLIDAGILDDQGNILRNVIHPEIRVHVYRNENDTDPVATYFAEETQFVYETTTFPIEGVATVELSGWIHGNHGYSSAATGS